MQIASFLTCCDEPNLKRHEKVSIKTYITAYRGLRNQGDGYYQL